MDLYTYYRSTSSYRVRIALELKGLDYRSIPVNLVGDGGEHLKPAYRALNPQGRVPALRLENAQVLIQSPAIIDDQGFCFGTPGLADVYLLPQVYAARRFAVDLNGYPRIARVERLALEHPAFQRAHPDAQDDKPA